MGALKLFAGIIGWASGGPIGALIGVFLASLFENSFRVVADSATMNNAGMGNAGRNSFLVSLLVLSSSVIRSDGKTLQPELNYVREFIRANFGDAAVPEAMRILNELNGKNVNVYEVGGQIAANMNYSQRVQLLHYLAGLANADGEFCKAEKSVLESIGAALGLGAADISSVIAMFYKDTESAYAVLEISRSATDEEVKTAYRRMAMKNHPDKVASLGPDVQKAAEARFRKIQEAYETIKKERGMN